MLQCPLCCNQFARESHQPRILVSCGHTICERCLRNILLNQSEFPCPECQTLTVVDQDEKLTPGQVEAALGRFPKNLALMHMIDLHHTQIESRVERAKILSILEPEECGEKQEESEEEDSLNEKKKAQGKMCALHGKKIKAFCNVEKELVCIECILSDNHKNHEVIAPQKAHKSELDFLTQQHQKALDLKAKVENQQLSLSSYTLDLHSRANDCRQEISSIFGQVRKLLQERETQLKSRISSQLEEQEHLVRRQMKDIQKQLGQISKFLLDGEKMSSEESLAFLGRAAKRRDRAKKALREVEAMDPQIPFKEVKQAAEVAKICKMIQSQQSGKQESTLLVNYSGKSKGKNSCAKYGKINLVQPVRNKSKDSSISAFTRKSDSQKFEISPRDNYNNITERKSIQQHQFPQKDMPFLVEKQVSECIPLKQSPLLAGQQPGLFVSKQPSKKSQEARGNSSGQKKLMTSHLKDIIENSKLNLERTLNQKETSLKQQQSSGKAGKGKKPSYVSNGSSLVGKLSMQQASEHFSKHVHKQQSKHKKLESTLFAGVATTHNNSVREANQHSYYAFKKKKVTDKLHSKKIHQSQSVQDESQDELNSDDINENKEPIVNFDCVTDSLDLRNGGEIRKPFQDIQRMSPLADKQLARAAAALHYQSDREERNYFQCEGVLLSEGKEVRESENEASEIITNSMIQDRNLRKGNQDLPQRKEQHKQLLKNLCQEVQNYIYVISGFKEQPLNSIEQYDVNRGVWKEIQGSLTIPRTKFQAVGVYDDNKSNQVSAKIYLLGGKKFDGHRTDKIEIFDPASGQTRMCKSVLPKARSGFAAFAAGQKVVIIGGNDGKVLSRVDVLDTATGKWESMPKMLVKRDELAVTVGPDNKIYAVGGYGGLNSECLQSVERYDPQEGKWEMLASLNEPRRALAAVALPDGVYALGGYNGQDYLQTVEKYDLSKGKWEYVKGMNNARCTFEAVVSTPDFQYIYAIGGFNGSPMDSVERYSVFSDQWEFVTPLKNARFMHSCAFAAQQDAKQVLQGQNQLFDYEDNRPDLHQDQLSSSSSSSGNN